LNALPGDLLLDRGSEPLPSVVPTEVAPLSAMCNRQSQERSRREPTLLGGIFERDPGQLLSFLGCNLL
jgi:hypothetical protein